MRRGIVGIFMALSMASGGLTARAADVPADARAAYNRGVDFYLENDYNKAEENFLSALNTEKRRLEQWTNYNLGNVNFAKGLAQEKQNPQAALPFYKQAREFFRRAIDLDPADKDAKYNFELTAGKIRQLEELLREQQQRASEAQESPPDDAAQEEQQPEEAQPGPAPEASADEKESEVQPAGDRPEQKEPEQMTPQEALMLLEQFQRSEKTQLESPLGEQPRRETGVEKDW